MAAPEGNRLLTYLFAFLAGIAGALLGWIATGFLADFVLGLGGMSGREGGRAMFAFFAVAPFGAVAGLVLGIWLVLRYQAISKESGPIDCRISPVTMELTEGRRPL